MVPNDSLGPREQKSIGRILLQDWYWRGKLGFLISGHWKAHISLIFEKFQIIPNTPEGIELVNVCAKFHEFSGHRGLEIRVPRNFFLFLLFVSGLSQKTMIILQFFKNLNFYSGQRMYH